MPPIDPFDILPIIAAALLDDASIGETGRAWLRRHIDLNDWDRGDIIRVVEIAPAWRRPLLRRLLDG